MATTIKLKNSVTTTAAPSSLVQGEVATNVTDKKIWVGNAASSPVQLLGAGATVSGTNVDYTGTLTGGIGVVNLGSGQFYKDASGNVGIGTASPSAKLEINGNTILGPELYRSSATSYLRMAGGTAGSGGNVTGYGESHATAAGALYLNSVGTGNMIFGTGGAERMRIASSGNVGIGTSSPTQLLDITSASSAVAIRLRNSGNDGGYISYSSANMTFLTDSSERMRIDSSGNLLVGGTTQRDNAKITCETQAANGISIYVNQDVNAADFAIFRANAGTLCGNISRIGTTAAVVYSATSDYRLKTVIAPVINAGERIDALKPIEYDWKAGGRAKGFLAHQFAEVYPNSVSGEKDAVDSEGKPVYQAMQASTSEVMADLIAEIQSLRKRVAQLESK